MVPLVNVVSVTALSFFGARDHEAATTSTWRHLATNPLIPGCLAGVTLNLSGIGLPSVIAVPVGQNPHLSPAHSGQGRRSPSITGAQTVFSTATLPLVLHLTTAT